MSSPRRTRSASVANTSSRRLRSRITVWDFSGFVHRLGSATCFSTSASCWRSLPVSKVLPQVAHFILERRVFLFQFFDHWLDLSCCDLDSARSALSQKLSHRDSQTNRRGACRTWLHC